MHLDKAFLLEGLYLFGSGQMLLSRVAHIYYAFAYASGMLDSATKIYLVMRILLKDMFRKTTSWLFKAPYSEASFDKSPLVTRYMYLPKFTTNS